MKNAPGNKTELAEVTRQLEQREAELAVINSVQEGLVAEMDMQGIYDLVGDRIRDMFDAQVTVIRTFDHDESLEVWEYAVEKGERLHVNPRPIIWANRLLINSKEPLLIKKNYIETAKKYGETGVTEGLPPKSAVFVPMVVGNEVVGSVSLQNVDRVEAFSESDVQLLSTLTNSMSVALENARLYNETTRLLAETEQRSAELAVINSVQEGLVAEMDMQGIYDLVGDRIRDLFDAQVTVIRTYDHDEELENFEYIVEKEKRFNLDPRPYMWASRLLINSKETLLIKKNYIETAKKYGEKGVTEGLPPKSAVFVPMIVGNEVVGSVSLQNVDRVEAFSESDVRLLSTLTNSMSVALENARLFNETTRLLAETEQRNGELAIINSVQEGLVREMDMETIYSLVGDRICEVLDTETLVIRTFDHEEGLEVWEYAVEKGERLHADPRPINWANRQLIKTKKHLVINENYTGTARKYGGKGFSKGLPPKSAIFMPMIVGDQVIGSVSLQNVDKEHAYSNSDVRLLTTLTNSMSVALENARLFNKTSRLLEETHQRATELDTVNRISRALVSQLELVALIEMVGELMRDTFKADIVYLALYEPNTDMLHFPYTYGEVIESRSFESGITEKIITKKEPLLINQNLVETFDRLEAEKKGEWVASFLGVPILIGNDAIGVISVQSTEVENRFDENDQRLLSTIAANVGIAMQNAEAYEQLRKAMEELRNTQEQLVKQEKLASLGQLTAGIAHEIKNPLNFVNNFADLSIELVQDIDELVGKLDRSEITDEIDSLLNNVEGNLKKIYEHGSRTDGIVKSMLQHSRGGSGKMEPTDLNALVKEFTNLAFHGMRAGSRPINVDIELELDDEVGEMNLIREDFSRVLLNLMNNAFDAMYMKLQNSDESYQPKLTVKTRREREKVAVEIADNGPGIPHDIREKVLQPFFTTKKGTEGTGLGLSITHDIIEAHGGTLEFESDSNGTLFTVNLNGNR
ncbi:MAG: GAF domain-containing protein [Balneolaceae bacterium]|nr:GAF domain-containing protein [Balneolaceae bacterium]